LPRALTAELTYTAWGGQYQGFVKKYSINVQSIADYHKKAHYSQWIAGLSLIGIS